MALVKDIFRISKGKKVSNVFDKPNSAYVRYIQIEDLRHNNNLKYTNESELVSAKESDVIIAWDGAYAGTIGFGISGIIGSTLARLTIKDEFKERCSGKYLGYFLSGKFSYFQNTATGATIPHVSKNALESLDISIPDIETQNKIVAILDKASVLVQKRRQTIDLLDELLRAQFLEMFQPDLLKINKVSTKLSDIATIFSGLTKGRKTNEKDLLEVPYLRVANAQDGYFDLREIKNIKATRREIEQYHIINRDILITEGGDPDKLGRGAVWEGEENKFIYQNHLYRIRLLNEKEYSAYWLIYLLGSSYGKYYFLRQAKQTTGIATINKSQVSNFPIPDSPFLLQEAFEKKYLSVRQLQRKLKDALYEINSFFNSIMQRAFSGKLNLNVSIELDALLKEIDLQKPENDLFSITTNETYLLILVNRLNNQEFESQDLYDKAKHAAFQLLKEEERLAQAYDEQTQRLKLVLQ